jgi:hypothetical protein
MKVESMDVVTLTATELKEAIIERVQTQTGFKVGEASLELMWAGDAPSVVRADGTQMVRGVKVSGILIRPHPLAPVSDLKCGED